MKRRQILSLGALLGMSRASLADESPTPRTLLDAAIAQRRVPSMRVELQMNITDAGREWVRTAVLTSRQGKIGTQQELFSFRSPADLAGSAVLTREEAGAEAAQWVYIPAYHTARRIPSANKGEAYLGTDYFYEDVLDPRWDDYSLKSMGVETLDKTTVHKIEALPQGDLVASTAYARTVYWLDTTRKLIIKQEYYDRKGKLLKRLTNASLKSYGSYLLWDAAIMENVQTGHKTVTQVLKRDLQAQIPDDTFTVKALKRAR